MLSKFRSLGQNFLLGNNYAIIAWMVILTISKWFSDWNGLGKPKRVTSFEDSLLILRDVTIKLQLLYPACSVCNLQIYWFVTQRAIICSATTMPKLNCASWLMFYCDQTFDSESASGPVNSSARTLFSREISVRLHYVLEIQEYHLTLETIG